MFAYGMYLIGCQLTEEDIQYLIGYLAELDYNRDQGTVLQFSFACFIFNLISIFSLCVLSVCVFYL